MLALPIFYSCIKFASGMPKPLSADWEGMKAGFVKGMTLNDLATKHRVKLGTIRCRAQREEWHTVKAKADSALLQVSQDAGIRHVSKVARFVNSKLDELMQFDFVSAFKTMDGEAFVRSLNTLDNIARRAYRLDEEQKRSQTLLSVTVNSNGSVNADGKIIELDNMQSITDSSSVLSSEK